MKIIPGILATTFREYKDMLERVQWAKTIHLDVMDGTFVPNKTIQALSIKKAVPPMKTQIHLMAHNPHRYINAFARMGAMEFIFHVEATDHVLEIIEDIQKAGMSAGIAFNPKTKPAQYKEAILNADLALVMTINPGYSRQPFMKQPLRKIEQIKKVNPAISIGVDGGLNDTSCKLVSDAGADWAVATSSVTLADDPKRAYHTLTRCK